MLILVWNIIYTLHLRGSDPASAEQRGCAELMRCALSAELAPSRARIAHVEWCVACDGRSLLCPVPARCDTQFTRVLTSSRSTAPGAACFTVRLPYKYV
mmetsp:Transcript_16843/g.49929  ORF Transcript_16843/g.49929 Transcript_16843/m.49929 type:complete len:99 (-) Transcript_16843:40-336(-)